MKSFNFLISTILILLCISVFFTIPANAATSVSFRTSDVQTDNNRLFYVDVIADSDKPLCAAAFEFRYDKSLAEFRSVNTDKDSKIVYNENSDCINISYLNTYGKKISRGDVIFSLQFKSVNLGSFNLDYTVSDCVDSDVKQMEIGSVVSGEIRINGKSTSSSSKEESTKSPDSSDASSTKSTADEADTQPSTVSNLNNLGLTSDISERNANAKFVIALIIICLVFISAVVAIALIFRKRIAHISSDSHSDDSKQIQNTE